MRILVVNKFFWSKGGSERVMFDLNRGYERAGHSVVPFAMASPDNRPTPFEPYFASNVDYEGARGLGALRAATRAIYSSDAKRRIRDLVRRTRPDVAHLHNFHHQLSPSIVDALREEKVPAVHTLHDYKVICPNYLLYTENRVCERCRSGRFHHAVVHRCVRGSRAASLVAWAEMTFHRWARTLERGVARFVSPSRFLGEKLVEFGVARERVRVIPNGIDASRFETAVAPGSDFLYVGRLSREKGLPTLLKALEQVPRARLTVTGTGPEERALRQEAQRLGSRVRFTGHLSRDGLLKRVRESRAVVLPSEWYENAPIAALEALASGVPVIASEIGGLPEIVRPRETGLLVPPGDPARLADALEVLEDDGELAFRLGARGREVVEREYSLTGQVDEMLSVLQEVASFASR